MKTCLVCTEFEYLMFGSDKRVIGTVEDQHGSSFENV